MHEIRNHKPLPSDWKKALQRFKLHLVALNRTQRTVQTRITQLATAARNLPDDPAAVTRDDIETWCGSQDWSPETRNGYYGAFRTFFRWYWRDDPERDPSAWLPSVRRPTPPPRPAPDKAINEALAKATPRTRLILTLAAELGLRANEIATLNVGDLAEAEDRWAVLTVNCKGGQIRCLPVSPPLAAAIRRHAGDGGWVFPGRIHGHLSARWVGCLATQVLPEPWALHTLRHRFATVAYNNGEKDLIAVQQALGHQPITTTQRYTQTTLNLKSLMTSTAL
ncbi:tyrosine-type recombinase/integrase [Corynebacterium cystitidis]|uniref:tyrosine-type recombinase/integrase n=1 Tax=Corynebacterium cystitidis TaxID=35757 RepID=UPI00211DA523|nr:site-specific integrase [Corynebacterium cystitidis]